MVVRVQPRTIETRRDRPGPEPPQRIRRERRPNHRRRERKGARQCPNNRDVSRPSQVLVGHASSPPVGPCLLTTCWGHQEAGAPNLPARVGDQDTQALMTGSVVTLLWPDLAVGRAGEPMEVACVYGDTRTYATSDWVEIPQSFTDCGTPIQDPDRPVRSRGDADNRSNMPTEPGRPTPPQQRHWEREMSQGEMVLHHQAHQPAQPARLPTRTHRGPPTLGQRRNSLPF